MGTLVITIHQKLFNLKLYVPMKKFLFLIILVSAVCFGQSLKAQDYNSAIGLRFGYPIAISYKTFLSESNALEAYAGYRGFVGYSWINVGALYQIHKPLSGVDGLQWYFGGGAGVQLYNYRNDFNFGDSGSFGIGLSGNLGLDYKFANSPINVSLDWVPTIFIGNGFLGGFGGAYGGLAVRYTLGG
jgi:hypothetical protein